MSSGFVVPEVLALAISLGATAMSPPDAGAREVAAIAPAAALGSTALGSATLGALDRLGLHRDIRWHQFGYTPQLWLAAVKGSSSVPRYGKFASRVFRTRSGRYYVPLANEKSAIFALRRNIRAAFLLTASRAKTLSDELAVKLARRPAPFEVFMTAKFGTSTAVGLIELAGLKPHAKPAGHYPQLAFLNTSLFFSNRRARSASDIYRIIRQGFNSASMSALTVAGGMNRSRDLAALVPPTQVVASLSWSSRVASVR